MFNLWIDSGFVTEKAGFLSELFKLVSCERPVPARFLYNFAGFFSLGFGFCPILGGLIVMLIWLFTDIIYYDPFIAGCFI